MLGSRTSDGGTSGHPPARARARSSTSTRRRRRTGATRSSTHDHSGQPSARPSVSGSSTASDRGAEQDRAGARRPAPAAATGCPARAAAASARRDEPDRDVDQEDRPPAGCRRCPRTTSRPPTQLADDRGEPAGGAEQRHRAQPVRPGRWWPGWSPAPAAPSSRRPRPAAPGRRPGVPAVGASPHSSEVDGERGHAGEEQPLAAEGVAEPAADDEQQRRRPRRSRRRPARASPVEACRSACRCRPAPR